MRPLVVSLWFLLMLSATALADTPAQLSGVSCDQVSCRTPFDTIPRFDLPTSMVSVTDGPWSAPATWSQERVPTATDRLQILHTVTQDSADAQAGSIGVLTGGTLQLVGKSQLTVNEILVMGGTLDGTGATLIFRGLPLQTVPGAPGIFDPYQYGNGLLAVSGTVRLLGTAKMPYGALATDVLAGATTLTLTMAPQGWHVGDVLVLPDTRQLAPQDLAPTLLPGDIRVPVHRKQSQSETVVIAAIQGATVTLQAGTTFAHLGARTPEGQLDILPHVGNLTRSMVLKSAGMTRGHTLYTGETLVDIQYTAFEHMGRTTNAITDKAMHQLDGTWTIGTNQIGRYPVHYHHLYGPCPAPPRQFVGVGNVVTDGLKWGLAVHDSHYGLIKDTIVYDTTGAGMVTEDGSETGNIFEGNLVIKSEASVPLNGHDDGGTDPFGRQGNGYWFRGPHNAVRYNVAADTREGFGWYTGAAEGGDVSAQVIVPIPNYACAQTTRPDQVTLKKLFNLPLLEVRGNEAYSTSEFGMGFWFFVYYAGSPPVFETTLWHFAGIGIHLKYVDGVFQGLLVRNEGGVGLAFSDSSQADQAQGALMLSELDVQGVETFFTRTSFLIHRLHTVIDGGLLRTKGPAIRYQSNGSGTWPGQLLVNNIRFQALPNTPLAAIDFTYNAEAFDANNSLKQVYVRNYQGQAGQDFRVFATRQVPSAPAPFVATNVNGCPEEGLTNQQCWDKHTIATMQEIASCADATTHPEIVGLTCPIASGTDRIGPSMLFGLRVDPTPAGQVQLSWLPSADNIGPVRYAVQRCQGDCDPATVLTTVTGTTYLDTTAQGQGGYSYAVVPLDASGREGARGRAALVLNTAPMPPVMVSPAILQQPLSQTVVEGQGVTVSVQASGTAPLIYQWQRNGSILPGASSATYTTPALLPGDTGMRLRCVVSNAGGTVTSQEAVITVMPRTQTPTFLLSCTVVQNMVTCQQAPVIMQ